MTPPASDRAALAARIQGFGNVNPPPLKDDTAADLAKRGLGNLGSTLREEVAMTVKDYREKGLVGSTVEAVKDVGGNAVGAVTGVFGWLRGGAPPEEEHKHAAAQAASNVLANGPSGAAYGVSQASATGGVNAVWVMPEDAAGLAYGEAQVACNSAGARPPGAPHIQPYQAPRSATTTGMPAYQPGMQMPRGGPVIQPYQPAGPAAGISPGAFRPPGSQQPIAPFAPGAPDGIPGGMPGGMPAPSASAATSSQSGTKSYVERIAKGEVLVSPEVAQRLTRQCAAANATAKQLGEMVCECARRLYLGLDGGDPAEADAALARILALADALAQLDGDLAKQAVSHIKTGVSEELTSLNSSAKHQAAALPMLQRLGLAKGGATAAAAESVDLLGGAPTAAPASADLLGTGGGPASPASVDLLGAMTSAAPAAAALGGLFDSGPAPAPQSDASALAGLNFDAAPPAAAAPAPAAPGAMPGTMGAGATMSQAQVKGDAFSFVGAELAQAGGPSTVPCR